MVKVLNLIESSATTYPSDISIFKGENDWIWQWRRKIIPSCWMSVLQIIFSSAMERKRVSGDRKQFRSLTSLRLATAKGMTQFVCNVVRADVM